MKQRFKLIYIPLILILLTGAMCIGLTDYITAGFDLEKLLNDPTFFVNIALTNIGILCVIIAILLYRSDKYKETDTEYNQYKNDISTFYKTKYYSPVFKLFIADINLENKRKAYIAKINKRASRIKPSQKDLDIVYTHSDIPEEEERLNKLREHNRYYKRIKYYDRLLSKAYIDQNIHKLNVKYNKLNDSMVFNEQNNSYENEEGLIKHKGWKVTKELLPRYLMSFIFVCFTTAVYIDWKDGLTAAVIFSTCSKLFTICSQIYFIWNYSDTYNVRYLLHDMQYRKSILSAYDMWEKRQVKKVGE